MLLGLERWNLSIQLEALYPGGSRALLLGSRGMATPERALVSVQTQEFSCVQEKPYSDSPSHTLTSSLENFRNLRLKNHFQDGAVAEAPCSRHHCHLSPRLSN